MEPEHETAAATCRFKDVKFSLSYNYNVSLNEPIIWKSQPCSLAWLGKIGGPDLCCAGRAPLGGEGKAEGCCRVPKERSHGWRLERGKSLLTLPWEGAPNPGETGGSGMMQMSLVPFFPTQKLNKAAAFSGPSGRPVISWGAIRPAHALFQFPVMAAITWPAPELSLCCARRSYQSGVSCFPQDKLLICSAWEVSSGPGAWPEGRTNCPKSSLSGCSQSGSTGAWCGSESCWHFCSVSSVLFPQHLNVMRIEANEINVFLLYFPGSSLEGQENCKL